jgi:hypothetical protein
LSDSGGRLSWWLDHTRFTNAVLTFAQNLLLPRLSHRLRWQSRLSPRGTLLYLVARVASSVVLVYLFLRGVKRFRARREALTAPLRARLGREPSPDEVFEYLTEEHYRTR